MTNDKEFFMTRKTVMAESLVESSRPAGPLRTCIGCRGKGGRSVLLRIVAQPGTGVLTLDTSATLPGRGAWIHRDVKCFQQATTRRAWGRALRLKQQVHTDQLEAQMAEVLSAMSLSDDEVPAVQGAQPNTQ